MISKRRHCVHTICLGFIWMLILASLSGVRAQNTNGGTRARSHQTIAIGGRFVLALQNNGTLWAWFEDNTNYFGARWILSRKSSVQIGTSSNWMAISAHGESALALRRDGTLWFGGSEAKVFKPPVQVGRLTNWTGIRADHAAYALNRDGEVWLLAGALLSELVPSDGESPLTELQSTLGPEDIRFTAKRADRSFWISRSVKSGYSEHRSPLYKTVFASVPEASNCVSFASCRSHTAIALPNGTLWAWSNGSDPDGNAKSISDNVIPRQIGKETNWVEVFAESFQMIGRKRDGSLWFWKHLFSTKSPDSPGILKHMTSEKPQRIGTDTNWNSLTIGRGSDHDVMATRRDGTLWIWEEEHPDPTRVGDLSNWGPPAE